MYRNHRGCQKKYRVWLGGDPFLRFAIGTDRSPPVPSYTLYYFINQLLFPAFLIYFVQLIILLVIRIFTSYTAVCYVVPSAYGVLFSQLCLRLWAVQSLDNHRVVWFSIAYSNKASFIVIELYSWISIHPLAPTFFSRIFNCFSFIC